MNIIESGCILFVLMCQNNNILQYGGIERCGNAYILYVNLHVFLITVNCLVQTVKTRVIDRNLNPVWKEELMLSVPFSPPPLHVVRHLSTSIGFD